jgi:uncharacterized membrane protein YfcA
MLPIVIPLLGLSMVAGFLGAIFGLGGGVLIVPALTLLFHIPIHVAIGASLIAVVATSAGASAAFVRDGWTNLRIAMALEVATVTGALVGALLAGVLSTRVLEGLFALALVLSASGASFKGRARDVVPPDDALARRLRLGSTYPGADGAPVAYGVRNLPGGAVVMLVAGIVSGMLGIGAGVLKVAAMDSVMGLPLKVSSATSNFMIGVTAGAGALVFLSRGDVSTTVAAPVALGVVAGAVLGGRILVRAQVRVLRVAFVVVLLAIAGYMGWRAWTGS